MFDRQLRALTDTFQAIDGDLNVSQRAATVGTGRDLLSSLTLVRRQDVPPGIRVSYL